MQTGRLFDSEMDEYGLDDQLSERRRYRGRQS
jgi:hypothetical protein